jgi:hypothetical protein
MALHTKTVTERILFTLNFADVIPAEAAVTAFIASYLVRIEVFTGIDPNPQDMFWAIQDVDELSISVQVQGGLPGVIYTIYVDVIISGEPYTKEVKIGVLPDAALIPQTYAVWVTSRPYPIFVLEGLEGSSQVIDGLLRQLLFDYFMGPEGIDGSSQVIAGELRDLLRSTIVPPEGIDGSSQVIDGLLRTLLFSTTVPPEGIDGFSLVTSGIIKNTLLTTIVPPEGIDGSSQVIGGTLT